MTTRPNQPDPMPDAERTEIPEDLLRDMHKAYGSDDLLPPSRVDDAVLRAAAAKFGNSTAVASAQTETKPGMLAWVSRRPIRSAGLGGALLAASVGLLVLIVGPPRSARDTDRSVAMESMLASEPSSDAIASRAGAGVTAVDDLQVLEDRRHARSRVPGAEEKSYAFAEREEATIMPPPAPTRTQALRGDVNGDGTVTIADALLLARMVDAAGGTLDAPRFDMLGDGIVSRADADAIARLVVRLAPASEESPDTEGAS